MPRMRPCGHHNLLTNSRKGHSLKPYQRYLVLLAVVCAVSAATALINIFVGETIIPYLCWAVGFLTGVCAAWARGWPGPKPVCPSYNCPRCGSKDALCVTTAVSVACADCSYETVYLDPPERNEPCQDQKALGSSLFRAIPVHFRSCMATYYTVFTTATRNA